jgi:hypothetical protein
MLSRKIEQRYPFHRHTIDTAISIVIMIHIGFCVQIQVLNTDFSITNHKYFGDLN